MGDSTKRKRVSEITDTKKSKTIKSNQSHSPQKNGKTKTRKKSLGTKSAGTHVKSNAPSVDKSQMSKRELRLASKEKTEARKKKRKQHYDLEKELAILWEKFRVSKARTVVKEDRSKFVSEALEKMRGKIPEIAGSHVSSRVLQSCVKFCSQAERDSVFEELRPHFITLSTNVYAVHLVNKLLDTANKSQLDWFISSLHGHVSSLLRHVVGSVVIEHAFHLANASQKCRLLSELYSTELQLFKDMTVNNEGRIVDIISKIGLQKPSVVQHMTSVIQPILEKGIADHSIIHTLLLEYFSIADKTSARDVILQLSGSLLVRMLHTRDGSKVGILCIKHGQAKERKKIIKTMKGLISKIAFDRYSCLVLISILSLVDDTKFLTKIVIRELQPILKNLLMDKNGRRPILQLLHPHCQSYFSQDDLASLNLLIPSLCQQDNEKLEKSNAAECGKKDPVVRRCELLIDSGLAESLVDTCIENLEQLIFSQNGKDVIYEVAKGGVDGILFQSLSEKLTNLHEAIASLAAKPKVNESKDDHVFLNFHASRIIRKLILECPAFATILWNSALKGNCQIWAEGHSLKVVKGYLESSDSKVRDLAKPDLQPFIDNGVLKGLDRTQPE